jgi:hypothetical protein
MAMTQGSWANVLFSPESKLIVSGLRLEDEELLQAEFKADNRAMLGSWLTSPPAPAGRLTIYSDHGRIFAEWRLRSGMKSVEELRESNAGKARRFDMTGGGYFVLTKSGDIEIWDQTALIAVGERIRIEAPAAAVVAARAKPAARSALGGAMAQSVAPVIAAGERSLPAPPLAANAQQSRNKPATAREEVVREAVANTSDKTTDALSQSKSKPRVAQSERAASKARAVTSAGFKNRGPLTTGDRITAQISGGF